MTYCSKTWFSLERICPRSIIWTRRQQISNRIHAKIQMFRATFKKTHIFYTVLNQNLQILTLAITWHVCSTWSMMDITRLFLEMLTWSTWKLFLAYSSYATPTNEVLPVFGTRLYIITISSSLSMRAWFYNVTMTSLIQYCIQTFTAGQLLLAKPSETMVCCYWFNGLVWNISLLHRGL